MKVNLVREKSYADCHAKGVYSLFINDGVRLFWASSEHDLYKNFPYSGEMSVGYHHHKAKIYINNLFGHMYHYKAELSFPYEGIELNPFIFDSKILGGTGKFKPTIVNHGLRIKECFNFQYHKIDTLERLDFHTIAVSKGKEAAWIVKECVFDNEGYQAPRSEICFSNANLTGFDPDGFYKPIEDSFWQYIVSRVQDKLDAEYWWINQKPYKA